MKQNRLHCGKNKGTALVALALGLAIVLLSGCRVESGESIDRAPLFVTHIVSDQDADGDIAFSPPASYIVASARTTGSVLAGIDPVNGDEFRGFLDFHLRESTGVPLHADIDSATLEIFITSVTEDVIGAGVPLFIDLVAFQPPALIPSDFDRSIQPALLSLPHTIFAADVGTMVAINVTSLMIRAQQEGLTDFQVRFVLDDFAAAALVEIEDSILETAPLLTVAYF